MSGTITLTTDFGTRDPYVGAMCGVILSRAPQVRLVEISHQIPPQDVFAGAYTLNGAAYEFPPDTVHLAVVDPGVGGQRRPLVVDAAGYRWVGPDNGLFSHALRTPGARAFHIEHPQLRREPVSATFHGRDLFAPTAAHLSSGFPVEEVGQLVDDPHCLPETEPQVSSDRIVGAIIHSDHFGNAVSCIDAEVLRAFGSLSDLRVSVRDQPLRIVQTYSDVEPNQAAALIGSGGLLEVVVRDGDATTRLGLQRTDLITVERVS